MKSNQAFGLFLMLIFHTACAQNQTNPPPDNFRKEHNGYSEAELKEVAASQVPSIQVRNMRQNRNGNILIAASWSGAFLYDGKSFTNLTIDKIGVHRYWDILEDKHGNLWFVTVDSGVYKYDGKTVKHFSTRDGLRNNMVMSVYEDNDGYIWFGASLYDGISIKNFTKEHVLPDEGVKAIMQDKTEILWFATEEGPCYYDARAGSIGGKKFTVLKNKDGKTFKNVWSIIEDKKGNIWFGVNDGLWGYDGTNIIKVSQQGLI